MANNPTTMLALPFYVSGARTLYITNDLTSSATAVTIPQGYYANFLVNSSSSDGTQANPYDVISEFNRACGQYFDFSLNEDGKTKITYRGIIGGTLSFVSSTLAKNILGFNTTSISFSSASVATSSYQPYGTVFTFGATNDTSWNRQFSSTGFSGLPDGRVYGFKDDYVKFTRKTDLRFHPYSQIEKELLSSNTATPVHQISKSLWGQPPSLLDSTYEQPYTLDHFLYESPGIPVREARSTLQQHLANTDNKFDIVYIDPETIAQENQYQPSIANYSKILDMKDLKVSLYQSALRTNRINSGSLSNFDPTQVSGLQAWWQADDVVLSASKITQFNDKSGNGRHATNNNATYQVTQSVDAAYNGKIVAITNGSANQVYTPPSFTASQPLTIFVVGDGSYNDWETFIDSSNVNRVIFRKDPTNYYTAYAGTGNVTIASVDVKTNPGIGWTEFNGASSKGNTNSNTATTLASNPGTNSLTQPILLVGNGSGYPLGNGAKFAATLVFNRQLSTTERTFVLSYFSSYYGITVSGI